MDKFIPFEKLSKKEQKKINLKSRNNWGEVNPSTKVVDTSKKKYSRKEKHSDNLYDI